MGGGGWLASKIGLAEACPKMEVAVQIRRAGELG